MVNILDLARFYLPKSQPAPKSNPKPTPAPKGTPRTFAPTPGPTPVYAADRPAPKPSYNPAPMYQPGTVGPFLSQVQDTSTGPSYSSGGGGGGGGGNSNLGQSDVSSLLQQEPGYDAPDFDSMIAPALQQADADIASLTGEFESYKSGALKQGDTARAQEQQYYTGKESELGRQKDTQTGIAESAADQARRQFSEITQGIQSRYGGTTGTGAFAESVAGSQAVQKLAEIKKSISQTIQSIDDKILEVREMGKLALQDINDKTQARIDDAKSNLDAQLRQIRNRKGELQANKAQMAYTAMQDYRSMVSKIRSDNQQFLQNLYLKQVDSENALKLKRTQASQAAETFTYFTSPDLQGQVIGLGNKTGTVRTTNIPGGGRLQKIGTEKEDLASQLENIDLTNIGD